MVLAGFPIPTTVPRELGALVFAASPPRPGHPSGPTPRTDLSWHLPRPGFGLLKVVLPISDPVACSIHIFYSRSCSPISHRSPHRQNTASEPWSSHIPSGGPHSRNINSGRHSTSAHGIIHITRGSTLTGSLSQARWRLLIQDLDPKMMLQALPTWIR